MEQQEATVPGEALLDVTNEFHNVQNAQPAGQEIIISTVSYILITII